MTDIRSFKDNTRRGRGGKPPRARIMCAPRFLRLLRSASQRKSSPFRWRTVLFSRSGCQVLPLHARPFRSHFRRRINGTPYLVRL